MFFLWGWTKTYILYSHITNNMKSIAPKPVGASKDRPPNALYPVSPSLVGEVGPNSSNWKFLELYYLIFWEGITGKYLRENEDKTLVLGLSISFPLHKQIYYDATDFPPYFPNSVHRKWNKKLKHHEMTFICKCNKRCYEKQSLRHQIGKKW